MWRFFVKTAHFFVFSSMKNCFVASQIRDNGRLEFASWYENMLAEALDPYRRFWSGRLSDPELTEAVDYAYEQSVSSFALNEPHKAHTHALTLLRKTTQIIDCFFIQKGETFGFSPDLSIYLNEVESVLERTIRKNSTKISTL